MQTILIPHHEAVIHLVPILLIVIIVLILTKD